jgi:hypothetical protein
MYNDCTHKSFIEFSNINLYPSSVDEAEDFQGDISISCGVHMHTSSFIEWTGKENKYTKALLKVPAPNLFISWPDRGVPRLGIKWWNNLIKWFESFEKKTDIVIHCHGGHGRTGTATAIIVGLTILSDDKANAGMWVQKNHCSKAIESQVQVDYISEILGVKQKGIKLHTFGFLNQYKNGKKGKNNSFGNGYDQIFPTYPNAQNMATASKNHTLSWSPILNNWVKKINTDKWDAKKMCYVVANNATPVTSPFTARKEKQK